MYSPVRSAWEWFNWIEKSTIDFSLLNIFGTKSFAKNMNPTSCMFGLHVLKPSFWLAHFDEKNPSKSCFWFDDGILYSRGAVIQRTVYVQHFYDFAEKKYASTCKPNMPRRLDSYFFAELCVPNIFKSGKKPIVDFPIQRYPSHADLTGLYIYV
jgi:hypothetical protein